MPREKEGYRDTLEQLNRIHPGRELLTQKEVMSITGWGSPKTVRKYLGPTMITGKVPKVALARFLTR